MPYGAVLYVFMLTAFAVLCSKYLYLHWYPGYVLHDTSGIPIYELPDFLLTDSCSHNSYRSGYLDTWLVLLPHHSHTRRTYMPTYRKTYSRRRSQYAVPVYDYASYFLLLNLPYRLFGFHESAWWTVAVKNHFFDWQSFHGL